MAFLTQTEMLAAFVGLADYIGPVYHSSAGPIADAAGVVVIFADTTGGGFQLDLPVSPDPRFAPKIINIGPNPLTIGGTVNGTLDPDISIQWSALELRHDGGTYYTGVRVTP
jgi:hypothetical protein